MARGIGARLGEAWRHIGDGQRGAAVTAESLTSRLEGPASWAARREASKEATVIGGFIIGVIAGGVAMWQYGDQIREFVNDKTKTVRHKAADGLMAVAETVEGGLRTMSQSAGSEQGSNLRSTSSPSGGRIAS